ncbi:DUF3347 domain-containing protein [Leptospira koniambonensis]|uniref:DUF3347 domain-containing protein n=1 Tax=Leptospira koniambonensis TaxID=2484950 RepID=A0A4R9J7I8_9LEPT|nr:DUF3347 domain-containing protein [Leptospira koniambonensis]TGL34168.1 DUF3347 domain-containing protein [Leptospira koniambonensis]
MKRSVILILLSSLLYSLSFCKKEEKPVLETEKPLFEKVLSENDKIIQFLLTTESVSPDVSGLISSLNSLGEAKGGLESSTLEMKNVLEGAKSSDVRISFEAYSKFSEVLASTMKIHGLQSGRNRFYCPMVKKTWVFSGMKILNPYAPDMRDCGDLIP